MDPQRLAAFVSIVMLAYVIPGPDWVIVLRHAMAGRRQGLIAAAGVVSGLMVHMTTAVIGLAALLLASAQAFTLLKLLGAGYLIVLGLQALVQGVRISRSQAVETPLGASGGPTDRAGRIWRTTFLANILNPKASIFFVVILPQFVTSPSSPTQQVFALGMLTVALGAAWWLAFIAAMRQLRRLLSSRRARSAVEVSSGVALISLGTGLVVKSNVPL